MARQDPSRSKALDWVPSPCPQGRKGTSSTYILRFYFHTMDLSSFRHSTETVRSLSPAVSHSGWDCRLEEERWEKAH